MFETLGSSFFPPTFCRILDQNKGSKYDHAKPGYEETDIYSNFFGRNCFLYICRQWDRMNISCRTQTNARCRKEKPPYMNWRYRTTNERSNAHSKQTDKRNLDFSFYFQNAGKQKRRYHHTNCKAYFYCTSIHCGQIEMIACHQWIKRR